MYFDLHRVCRMIYYATWRLPVCMQKVLDIHCNLFPKSTTYIKMTNIRPPFPTECMGELHSRSTKKFKFI